LIRPGHLVALQQYADLLCDFKFGGKYLNRIQISFVIQWRRYLEDSSRRRRIRNEPGRPRSLQNMFSIQIIRVGIAGFLTRNDAYADSDTDALGCSLDDLFFQND